MGSRSKRVAFIPVRGGSKGIPNKNIKKIAGKPLVYWAIDAALTSRVFDEVYISTDDSEIKSVINRHPHSDKLKVVTRSAETATDNASTESAMIEFAEAVEFKYITLIQATSPLLKGNDLKEGLKQFLADKKTDSMLSVCRQERFIWNEGPYGYCEPQNYDPNNRPRRQDFDGFLVENGAFYITSKQNLLDTGSRLSGNISCYEMAPESYYELDELSDWKIIEALLQHKSNNDRFEKLKDIKLFLTDVDGVLTDAGMYYSEKGDELKKFNTRDGKGLELLRNRGIEVGIITTEDTQIVSDRAAKLNLSMLYQGIKEKGELLAEILEQRKISSTEVAYIGDDINDLPIIKNVGFSACPADAMHTVQAEVDYICHKKGGEGCVRELSEMIINSLSK